MPKVGKISLSGRFDFCGESLVLVEDGDRCFRLVIRREEMKEDFSIRVKIIQWSPRGISLVKIPGVIAGPERIWITSSRIKELK